MPEKRVKEMRLQGKCSWFGGPNDTGVTASEDLAFWEDWDDVVDDQAEELFLPQQPPGTSGLARRLNPENFYIACRWDYGVYPKTYLAGKHKALIRAENGRQFLARPADWGPNENTGRICDLSPGLMNALGLTTDDTVIVIYPFGEEQDMTVRSVVISAGHGENVPGAEGLEFDEEDETPIVTHKVAEELRRRGVTVTEFWDTESTNVSDNLSAIVDFHNSQPAHDLDISCHFNASDGNGHGVEVLFLTQEELAAKVSAAIAAAGPLTDRGAKYRNDLKFLNSTKAPAILIETCFLDNAGDVSTYQDKLDAICAAIAAAIADAPALPIRPPPPDQITDEPVVHVSLTVPEGVTLKLTINGEIVLQDS
jgi:N-acetylmuramoyl-L-alanine amidase